MMWRFIVGSCLAALLPLVVARVDGAESPVTMYRAGVAQVDITPEYPVRLSGFGFRRTESEGVTQRIWTKALALQHGDAAPALIITTDNLGIPASMVTEVADRLQQKVGLPRDRLAVTATHTHTAPMLKGVAPTLFGLPIPPEHQSRIDRYTRELTDHIEQAALEALKSLEPARLEWGLGTVKFATNRRTAGGPVDHDLPVLFIKNLDGKIRSIYTNYACHCVTLSNNQISGDWAGYAQDLIQREFPGSIALVSVGCGADSNPSSGVTGDKVTVAEQQGLEIAAEVKRLSNNGLIPLDAPLQCQLETLSLSFTPAPTRAEFEARVKQGSYIGYHAQVQLERLDRGEVLQRTLDYPIQTWSFGDRLAMVFLPGEVVVDYALRLKKELDGQRLWVVAYANDEPCYIPSERILKEGGYEGGGAMTYYDRPSPLAAGLEQQIIDAIQRQIGNTFAPRFDAGRTQGSMPRSAVQSLSLMQTRPEFQVELVVAEPLISDPVAIAFGPEGNLWVAEMHDYPTGLDGNYQPGGRVRLVTDNNRDGRYDHSTVFLEGIPFPTGITVWRDGVLVCAAPDILFARDTDQDGRADDIRKLYTGFGTGNFQARVNSLEYGLDGWIYGSCGLFGGQITNFKGETYNLGDRDFRIQPDTGAMEAATGRTQQGRVRDDWGNWFGCDNSNLCRHYPLADHDLRRNPHAISPQNSVNVATSAAAVRLFPAASVQRFKLSGPENNVTAACGLGIYRDTLLGPDYLGNAFTCEPVNLLVHRLQLVPQGSTFTGTRPEVDTDTEFLRSSDEWFRPVQATTGPDGALWVVDMYRYIIEHPRWIPEDTVAQLDVRAGHSMGRIYRVVPRGRRSAAPANLLQLSLAQLAAHMESANGWQRDMISQLLQWKTTADAPATERKAVQTQLERLATASNLPVVRLQALCTLDQLRLLPRTTLLSAINDADAGVRRHAIRIAGGWLVDDLELQNVVARLDDNDSQVSLQQACTLAELPDEISGAALARVARKQSEDPYIIAAVMSSLRPGNINSLLHAVLDDTEITPFHRVVLPQLTLQAIALQQTTELPSVVQFLTARRNGDWEPWQFTAVAGLMNSGTATVGASAAGTATDSPPAWMNENVLRSLGELRGAARLALQSDDEPIALRIAAIDLLAHGATSEDLELLQHQLSSRADPQLQSRVVEALSRTDRREIPQVLTKNWSALSPSRQSQILDTLLSRPQWTALLLEMMDAGQITPNQVDAVRRQRLLQHADGILRSRAEKLFAGATSQDRQHVLTEYQSAATMEGDVGRGQALFTKTCAVCHQLGRIGQQVGPDLSALASKSPQFLLQEILDPNRNVDSRYVQYTIALQDGRVQSGLLASESGTTLSLKNAEGREVSILRSDIEEIVSSGKSLMPEGLERDLTRQNIADILAFITHVPSPPKRFPGNCPAVITVTDGRVTLPASAAEIRGTDIVFEEPFQNVGYWHGPDDHVTWHVQLEQPAQFDVYLEYACATESAGNAFILSGTHQPLQGEVLPTGGWDHYQRVKIGTLALGAGNQRLVIRPVENTLRGALLDLKAVHLVPPGTELAMADENQEPAVDKDIDPKEVIKLVQQLLDDRLPAATRQEIIQKHPQLSSQLIAGMTDGLSTGSAEEYRRIPWIWRVAIAAGRRNKVEEILAILEVSLPQPNQPLHDWRAVVVGGGIINGISLEGHWPAPRLAEILKDQEALLVRWQMALDEAAKVTDDEQVPTGTRYDALRMIALDKFERRGGQLEKYLAAGVHPELQMGAVSGLVDVDQPAATALLIKSLPHLPEANRKLALEGLLRGEARQQALIQALELRLAHVAWITPEQREKLVQTGDPGWQQRARKVFGK